MSKILIVESVTLIDDYGQSTVQCVETGIGLVKALGPNERAPDNFELVIADIHDFAYYDEGKVKRFKIAWHPEFEKELGISLDVISGQSADLERLRMDKAILGVKLDTVINMSFVKRVKFAFTGRVE